MFNGLQMFIYIGVYTKRVWERYYILGVMILNKRFDSLIYYEFHSKYWKGT